MFSKSSFDIRLVLIVLLLLTGINSVYSENAGVSDSVSNQNRDTTTTDDKIDYTRLCIASGITTGVLTYSFFDQYGEYWRNNGRFHIMTLRNEYDDALMSDKFGHLYITYAATKAYRYAFEWIGMDSISGVWWSACVAMAHQTFTEIQDGFSHGEPYLGFSFGDYFANVVGAGFAILQEYEPFLRNFNFKVGLSQRNYYKQSSNNSILQDYERRFNWVSVNIHNLLPEELRKYYPSFVNLAAGFIVSDIDRYGGGYHKFYIGLDWNFPDEMLEEKQDENIFSRLLKNVLNLYHFPAPAIKVYPDVVWYGLLF